MDRFLLFPLIHHPRLRGFRATSRQNDWLICAETHTQACRLRGEWQPPRIKLATWPGILCAHDFRSETTEAQKLFVNDECIRSGQASETGKGWKVLNDWLNDCERLFIKGPTECAWNILKKGLFHFILFFNSHQKDQLSKLSPCLVNRTCYCDATWRPTEVYIDFGRPARRWKRWCLLDNDGRNMKALSWTRFLESCKVSSLHNQFKQRSANESSGSRTADLIVGLR